MKHTHSSAWFAVRAFASLILLATPVLMAQEANPVVPPLVKFSGVLSDANQRTLTGTVGVTFALYSGDQGGSPLWLETQNVKPDNTGHYSVMLGSASGHGLPPQLFASGEARWLGVQVQGQAEQPRVMLLAVPYALKAGDAQTVGGLPASAFVLASPAGASAAAASNSESPGNSNPAPPAGNVTGSGAVNFLPIWTGASTIGNSVLFQSGTGAKAKLGIGTTKPASTLDVKGGGTIRGLFSLPATGTATASKGFNSQPMDLVTSVFNSGTSTAVTQTFQWQTEPVGNNTSTATGSLNLLFGQGTNKPTETGLNVASNGKITFATGQTFPGTGTITGVTAGTDLTGGGNSGNVTLNVDTTKVVTGVTAGTDLTGGGTGGTPTLNLDTTKVPQLSANNSFTGNQTVSGSVTAASFSGNGASLTNVNASQLGGLAPNAYAQLASINKFTNDNIISASTTATPALLIFNTGVAGDGIDIYPSSSGYGLFTSGGAAGVYASGGTSNAAVTGTGSLLEGIYGDSATDSDFSPGILGIEKGSTTRTVGVFGETYSTNGAGVYGQTTQSRSGIGGATFIGSGVWGDGGSTSTGIGVLGTADNNSAAVFNNSSGSQLTVQAVNYEMDGYPFGVGNGPRGTSCLIDQFGDLLCTGSKNAVVPIDGGQKKVALAAIESPKNWFEDFGSEQLSNGAALIAMEPEFAQTVNTDLDYHVFLTPKADCKGLYVANETSSSFEVHELGGGTSSVRFDYRIVALRKNFENIRLADHTNDPSPLKTVKKGTPTHFDIDRSIPPKREARLTQPITASTKK
jgi:hypothetical protein